MENYYAQLTHHNIVDVLQTMITQCANDEDMAIMYVEMLDPMLDSILQDDGFGSEGQLDPRGSHRD